MTYKSDLIEDNKRAENQSFLYLLHEEKKFDVKALEDLCHLVYHFDDNDLSKISNLPFEYWEYIEPFERLMACLYEGDGEE